MRLGRLVFLLALLVPAWPPPASAEPGPDSHLEDETLENVLYVTAGQNSGTAFLLEYAGARYLVTARHVVQDHLEDPTVPVRFVVGGKRGRVIRHARAVKDSLRADIAVFTYDDEEDGGAPYFSEGAGLVAHGDLHLASRVFLVGYPASLKQTYGSSQLRVVGGWVAGLKKYVPGSTVEFVDIDMPGVEHGHSGGPILLLQDRVVAVAVQRRTGSVSQSIGATYAVPIKYVTALIDDEPVEEDVSALNETLRGTALVCGLSLQGKNDYDIWAQRIHRETGETLWGEMGIYVASSPKAERDYVLVPSAGGSTLVVHTLDLAQNGEADIMVQRISPYGELLFDAGERSLPIASTDRAERSPAAVSDGADGAIVLYEMHLESGDVDVMAQRVSPNGERRWDVAGVPVATAKAKESSPRVVADDAGGAIAVFEVTLEDGDVDIMAQRIRPDGLPAWREGARSLAIASTPLREVSPRCVSDGDGGVIVVYETVSPDGDARGLSAQRVSRHGEMLWGDGVAVTGLPLSVEGERVSVAADGLGGAFVGFEILPDPERPQDVDVAVQRLSAEGKLQWGKEGSGGPRQPVLAASSPWPELAPFLVSDGQGGVIVGFESGSDAGDLDVWAQRVDGEGKLLWNRGERSAEVSLTFLSEHSLRVVDRHRDVVLFLFEVERESGWSAVACQALSLETGRALYGEGKLPLLVLNPGDTEIGFFLAEPR